MYLRLHLNIGLLVSRSLFCLKLSCKLKRKYKQKALNTKPLHIICKYRDIDAKKSSFNSTKVVRCYKVLFIYGGFLGADPGEAVPCAGKPSCALHCSACALTPLQCWSQSDILHVWHCKGEVNCKGW